jgi:hypothetical protein
MNYDAYEGSMNEHGMAWGDIYIACLVSRGFYIV